MRGSATLAVPVYLEPEVLEETNQFPHLEGREPGAARFSPESNLRGR